MHRLPSRVIFVDESDVARTAFAMHDGCAAHEQRYLPYATCDVQHEPNTQAPEQIVRAAQAPRNKRDGTPAFWAADKRNAKKLSITASRWRLSSSMNSALPLVRSMP